MKHLLILSLIAVLLLASCSNSPAPAKPETTVELETPEPVPTTEPPAANEPIVQTPSEPPATMEPVVETPSEPVEPIMYEVYGTTPLVKSFAEAMFRHETSIDITGYDESIDTILYSATEAIAQNPMIIGHPGTYIPAGNQTLEIEYTYSAEEAQKMRDQIWEVVRQMVRDSNYPAMTDYEKTEFAFKTIVDWVTYDYESFLSITAADQTNAKYNPHSQDAYGPFVEGLAVCVGYSQAYAILARAIGLEAVVIDGNVSEEPHAWNRVNLNGDWVSTDTTYGDAAVIDYSMLNRSWEVFSKTRVENMYGNRADLGTWPSVSDDYNYYKQHYLIFTMDEAKQFITEQVAKDVDFITVMLTTEDVLPLYDWVYAKGYIDTYSNYGMNNPVITFSKPPHKPTH